MTLAVSTDPVTRAIWAGYSACAHTSIAVSLRAWRG